MNSVKQSGVILHQAGFYAWFLCFFKYISGQHFLVESFHLDLINLYQDVYDLKHYRVIINIPPRSGKTTISFYFIAYCLAVDKKCNFIYTSYSQSLLSSISKELKNILEHPIYQAMYECNNKYETVKEKAVDKFWENYLISESKTSSYSSSKITTSGGGIVLLNSIGSAITGFGCFSFDTLILTEYGYLKLGDIVEKQLNIRIYSYNFNTNERELDYIDGYVKNQSQPFLKITLDNGEEIEATTDHIFYKDDNTEIRADELQIGMRLFSNSFNYSNRYIKFFSNILSRIIFINNKINHFFRNNLTFKRGYRKIINIVNCNHNTSYCLTIRNNHNMFISNSQVLVHNCGHRQSQGKFTGCLIIDDANKSSDMQSEVMINKVQEYYHSTLLSRLNNEKVAIINVQQRLHNKDLTGFLLERYGHKKDEKDILKFHLLKKPLVNEEGIIQLKSQYSQERINELKINNYVFETQYQQNPINISNYLTRDDFHRRYTEDPLELATQGFFETIVIAGDTASGLNDKTNAYTAFAVVGLTRNGEKYIIDIYRQKQTVKTILEDIADLYFKWKKTTDPFIYIENASTGSSIWSMINTNGFMNKDNGQIHYPTVTLLSATGSKDERMYYLSLQFQNKRVVLPTHSTWLKDLEYELLSYPHGKYKDQCDALGYAVKKAI